MARNGSGVYSKPANTTAISGTTIESTMFNTLMDDIVSDLNLDRPVTAGGTGASTAADARANLGIKLIPHAIDTTGSSNTYAVTTGDSLSSLTDGYMLVIIANHSNSGAATLNADTLGATAVKKFVAGTATALASGDLVAATHYILTYDSGETAWIVHVPSTQVAIPGTNVQAWDAALDDFAGLTQATDKIPYFDSATTMATLDFLDEDNMASDSDTGVPSQQSVKAYVDAQVAASGGWTVGTAKTLSSGTTSDFTSLPTGLETIEIAFSRVSTNGTSGLRIELGHSAGTFQTSGYISGASNDANQTNDTTAFAIVQATAATDTASGVLTLSKVADASDTWAVSGCIYGSTGNAVYFCAGDVALAAELDAVRLTTAGGVNTFDGGTWNIKYM